MRKIANGPICPSCFVLLIPSNPLRSRRPRASSIFGIFLTPESSRSITIVNMVFSSTVFLFAFLPIAIAVYFLLRNRKARNVWLLVISLAFYAWGEPVYVLLMIASIVMNWLFGLKVKNRSGKANRALFICAIVFNIAVIGFFKYEGFLADNLNAILGAQVAPNLELPLPIGISFYTLQALSYVIDVYRGDVPPQRNLLYLGMYIACFPQLIAGPIVRYKTISDQIVNRTETLERFHTGLRLFIIGLSKKVLLANLCAILADRMLSMGGSSIGFIGAWGGLLAYTFQIYFDFGGYSDMAIGLGRMMGFEYLRNFNYPYIATSISEFWRRWHISLYTFFRDYVYIPLGGSRVTTRRWIFNMAIVWFATGVWHGAAWHYIFWGVYYGVLLVCEKLVWGKTLAKAPKPVQHLYAIIAFVLGWLVFWAPEEMLPGFVAAMAGVYGLTGSSTMWELTVWEYMPVLVVCIIACTPIVPWIWEQICAYTEGRLPRSITDMGGGGINSIPGSKGVMLYGVCPNQQIWKTGNVCCKRDRGRDLDSAINYISCLYFSWLIQSVYLLPVLGASMGKMYRAVVVGLVSVLCFSAMWHFTLSMIFPGMFDTTSYLSGGTSSTITTAEVLADPIGVAMDSERLTAFEDSIGDMIGKKVPFHDGLLLVHAKLHRMAIAESASLFDFDEYPSFYGSAFACSPRYKTVLPVISSKAEVKNENDAEFSEILHVYSTAIKDNPGIDWVFYIADSARTSKGNPTTNLVTDPATYDYFYETVTSGLPDTAVVLYSPYDDVDELFLMRYKTDHHWNINGAIAGYRQIANALGIQGAELDKSLVASYDDFYGSYARQALCLDWHDDGIEDVAFDLSNLKVKANGQFVDPSVLDFATKGIYEKQYLVDNLYARCFHGGYALLEITNDRISEGTLLIIGDSYSYPMERFFSDAYHNVIVYDPRERNSPSLQEVISDYSPDAIVSIQMAKSFFEDDRLNGLVTSS